MSDPVAVTENDNTNPDVDTLASVTTESHTIVCEAELDDDFFVCRKCNKVFKDLSEYLEHKIKDENYKLSHTRSKNNKKMVIPQLVEKKPRSLKKKNLKESINISDNSNPTHSDTMREESQSTHDDKSDHVVNTSAEINVNGSRNVTRGRKGKSEPNVHEPPSSLGKDNKCHLCNQKFRRAAALRWHMKYDHKEKDNNSDESDAAVDEQVKIEVDEDFVPRQGQENEEQGNCPLKEDSEKVGFQQKVTVVSTVTSKAQHTDDSETLIKTEANPEERPYICDICGRGFKELPVYKAHAIVHSNERNFVCTAEGCPYGFKTKGSLVRHMRRHTGERPYSCEKCGRSFAESGALNRHLKARRNCAQTTDSHYPRYKKKWSYHPNIEAVVDQAQRDVQVAEEESLDTIFIHGEPMNVTEVIRDKVIIESSSNTDPLIAGAEKSVPVQWSLNTEGASNTDANVPKQTVFSEPSENANMETSEKNNELYKFKSVSDIELLKELQCQVCRKDFQLTEQLEVHLRTHLADQPTHCGLCHFLAQNRDDMRQHILTMHAESLDDIESTMFAMDNSDQDKSSAQQKDERMALREALTAIKQLHRLKSFGEKSSSGSSSLQPSTTGSLQCMICYRTFKGISYMRQHMRMHTGDRPFKCNQCDSTFTSKDVLKKHIFVHMNQRDYKCGECGKMFKRLVHVQQHIKTHSQERSYRCNICEKLFKTHNSLKVHLRTHTNVNPYRCQVCNRHFRERGSLQRHMRLHTGEKPYICPHCNRGFAEQGTLSRHLKAKVPCSATRYGDSQLGPPNSTMLAQFSSMVADTQYILPSVNSEELSTGNLIVLKTEDGESEEVIENIEVITEENVMGDKEQVETLMANENMEEIVTDNNTETLQVYDSSTGETLIITGDKSVMEMVKSQQVAIESMNGGLNLDKIRDILMAAGEGQEGAPVSTENLIEIEDESNIVVTSEEIGKSDNSDIIDVKWEMKTETSREMQEEADLETQVVTVLSSHDGADM